jgi:hypothetical protein
VPQAISFFGALISDDSIPPYADYKTTVNQHLLDDKYPIPNKEDILIKLFGGRFFRRGEWGKMKHGAK